MFFEPPRIRPSSATGVAGWMAKTTALQSGNSYVLELQMMHGQGGSNTHTHEVERESVWFSVLLCAKCGDGHAENPIHFASLELEVPLSGVEPQLIGFEFIVTKTPFESEFEFLIFMFHGTPAEATPVLVGQILATVTGGPRAPREEDYPSISIPASRAMPPHLATLVVERQYNHDDGRTFTLLGHCGDIELREHVVTLPPNSLEALIEMKDIPDDIYGWMAIENQIGKAALFGWLKRLFAAHADDLTILIIEQAVTEYCWEFLDVADGEKLGSKATVARWFPVEYQDTTRQVEVEYSRSAGNVVGYLALDSATSYSEKQTLAALDPNMLENAAHFLERLNRLSQSAHRTVAALYLGCHGRFVVDRTEFPHKSEIVRMGLGALTDGRGTAISLLDLSRLRVFQPRVPMVFVNACHSGRLARRHIGIAQVVLAHVTDGYVGTLGKVGSNYAGKVGESFLHSANSREGVNPAAFLRDMRKAELKRFLQALDNLDASDSDRMRAAEDMLYAFSYVFYGNPFATISLTHN